MKADVKAELIRRWATLDARMGERRRRQKGGGDYDAPEIFCRPCWRDRKAAVIAVAIVSLTGSDCDRLASNNVPVCKEHGTLERIARICK